MVLYFLQQRQPPVVPVLQEVPTDHLSSAQIKETALPFMFQIFDGTTVPQRMVDGWNAFFCDDLSDLVSF